MQPLISRIAAYDGIGNLGKATRMHSFLQENTMITFTVEEIRVAYEE